MRKKINHSARGELINKASNYSFSQRYLVILLVSGLGVLVGVGVALRFYYSTVVLSISIANLVLVVFAIAGMIVIFMKPWIGFLFLICSLPLRSFSLASFGAADIRISEAIFIIVALAWVLNFLAESKIKLKRSEIDFPLIIFFLWIILSFLWSSDIISAIVQSSRVLFGILLYFVTIQIINSEKRLRQAINLWVIVGFSIALIAIFEFFYTGLPYLVQNFMKKSYIFTRSLRSSVFLSPTLLGSYLNLCLFLFIGKLVNAKTTMRKIMSTALLFALFLALLFTFSRGAWIGFFLGLIYLLYKFKALMKFAVVGLIIIFILVFIVGGVIRTVVVERIMSFTAPEEDPAFQERLLLWRSTKKIILDHPILGVGIGNSAGKYEELSHYYPTKYRYTHNLYLNITAELGLIGLALFLWLCVSIARAFFNFLRKTKVERYYNVIVPFVAGLISYAIHGMLHFHLAERHIWAFLGISMAVTRVITEEIENG